MTVALRKIDTKNVWALTRLRVAEHQTDFVASNTQSILEAYATISEGGVALPFGIYDGETPVGFLMIGYGTYEGAPSVADGNYSLWRLMIDQQYQKKGYGAAAIRLALDYVRAFPCGAADACWLSYEPENEVAKSLYHRFGFRENGETEDGEIVAVLKL